MGIPFTSLFGGRFWRGACTLKPPMISHSEPLVRVVLISGEERIHSALRDACALHGTAQISERFFSVEDALRGFHRSRAGLALVDDATPGVSNGRGIGQLRSLSPALPIIALSGHDTPRDVVMSLMAGAAGCLVKPLDPVFLARAILEVAAGKPVLCRSAQRLLMEHLRAVGIRMASLNFSQRESDVVDALCKGESDKEIAARLGVAPGTIHTHLARLYRKLGVHGRREAVERINGL